uniref:(California timema) hypothetical protein n=1 Tax=Timema californicum TaxID=61474 RepID=A0A7R9P5T6_TIMCA|nr:unnamed protein product [Timema californicum]
MQAQCYSGLDTTNIVCSQGSASGVPTLNLYLFLQVSPTLDPTRYLSLQVSPTLDPVSLPPSVTHSRPLDRYLSLRVSLTLDPVSLPSSVTHSRPLDRYLSLQVFPTLDPVSFLPSVLHSRPGISPSKRPPLWTRLSTTIEQDKDRDGLSEKENLFQGDRKGRLFIQNFPGNLQPLCKQGHLSFVFCVPYEDFVNLDENLVVCGELRDAEFLADVMNNTKYDSESSDEEGQTELPEKPIPTSTEAMDHIEVLRLFVEGQHNESPSILQQRSPAVSFTAGDTLHVLAKRLAQDGCHVVCLEGVSCNMLLQPDLFSLLVLFLCVGVVKEVIVGSIAGAAAWRKKKHVKCRNIIRRVCDYHHNNGISDNH